MQTWKRLKLKVRKFLGPIPAFVEATGEKLVGGPFCPPLPPILNRVNGKLHFLCSVSPKSLIKINNYLSLDGYLFLHKTLSSTLAFQFLLCWDQPISKRQNTLKVKVTICSVFNPIVPKSSEALKNGLFQQIYPLMKFS